MALRQAFGDLGTGSTALPVSSVEQVLGMRQAWKQSSWEEEKARAREATTKRDKGPLRAMA